MKIGVAVLFTISGAIFRTSGFQVFGSDEMQSESNVPVIALMCEQFGETVSSNVHGSPMSYACARKVCGIATFGSAP
eukprot:SAG31_NODE_2414_length_5736_cov_5.853823_2_plen_77_part_00